MLPINHHGGAQHTRSRACRQEHRDAGYTAVALDLWGARFCRLVGEEAHIFAPAAIRARLAAARGVLLVPVRGFEWARLRDHDSQAAYLRSLLRRHGVPDWVHTRPESAYMQAGQMQASNRGAQGSTQQSGAAWGSEYEDALMANGGSTSNVDKAEESGESGSEADRYGSSSRGDSSLRRDFGKLASSPAQAPVTV